jgi:hypothetical protein
MKWGERPISTWQNLLVRYGNNWPTNLKTELKAKAVEFGIWGLGNARERETETEIKERQRQRQR